MGQSVFVSVLVEDGETGTAVLTHHRLHLA